MITTILLDYKEFSDEAAEQFADALIKLGIYMYDDPRTKGASSYGFILSNKRLTKHKLNELTAELGE